MVRITCDRRRCGCGGKHNRSLGGRAGVVLRCLSTVRKLSVDRALRIVPAGGGEWRVGMTSGTFGGTHFGGGGFLGGLEGGQVLRVIGALRT